MFGEHVHVGYYKDPSQMKKDSWQKAQFDHINAVLEVAGVRKAEQLVDLGCGYGGTAVHVARQLNCKAVGVNISPFQVQAANKLAQRSGFAPKDVHFVVGDALAPALPDASYDLVLALESSTYMPDKDMFVQQLARLCRPGGTVVLVDFVRKAGPQSKELVKRMGSMNKIFATSDPWKSAEEFKAMMVANGLTVVKSEEWTRNIRGFWSVPVISLMFRKSHPKQKLPQQLWQGGLRTLRMGWLMLTGGPKVLEMSWSLMSGGMGRVVQGGLDGGDIEYHVIVAKKP